MSGHRSKMVTKRTRKEDHETPIDDPNAAPKSHADTEDDGGAADTSAPVAKAAKTAAQRDVSDERRREKEEDGSDDKENAAVEEEEGPSVEERIDALAAFRPDLPAMIRRLQELNWDERFDFINEFEKTDFIPLAQAFKAQSVVGAGGVPIPPQAVLQALNGKTLDGRDAPPAQALKLLGVKDTKSKDAPLLTDEERKSFALNTLDISKYVFKQKEKKKDAEGSFMDFGFPEKGKDDKIFPRAIHFTTPSLLMTYLHTGLDTTDMKHDNQERPKMLAIAGNKMPRLFEEGTDASGKPFSLQVRFAARLQQALINAWFVGASVLSRNILRMSVQEEHRASCWAPKTLSLIESEARGLERPKSYKPTVQEMERVVLHKARWIVGKSSNDSDFKIGCNRALLRRRTDKEVKNFAQVVKRTKDAYERDPEWLGSEDDTMATAQAKLIMAGIADHEALLITSNGHRTPIKGITKGAAEEKGIRYVEPRIRRPGMMKNAVVRDVRVGIHSTAPVTPCFASLCNVEVSISVKNDGKLEDWGIAIGWSPYNEGGCEVAIHELLPKTQLGGYVPNPEDEYTHGSLGADDVGFD